VPIDRRLLFRVTVASMIAVAVALCVGLVLLPHPESWSVVLSDREYPQAICTAWRFVNSHPPPNNAMVNALTDTVIVRDSAPNEVEVVLLPRKTARRMVMPKELLVINVRVQRQTMRVLRLSLMPE